LHNLKYQLIAIPCPVFGASWFFKDLGGHDTQAERALELYDRLGCEVDQLHGFNVQRLGLL